MTIRDLIALFNIKVRTEYNLKYQSFEPAFSDLLFEYPSGAVGEVNFPFFGFLRNMEKFTGSRKHQTFPEGYKFVVRNEEWDMSVDVFLKDLERAAGNNGIDGLNIYSMRIGEMPKQVKDHPVELAFDMLENGDASTYGTTFDGQNFFATTHSYGTAAGSQSNIVTGTGVTVALLIDDLTTAMTTMNSFNYNQGGDGITGNAQKRKLNPTMNKLLVVCPDQLWGKFEQVRTLDRLANGADNPMKGRFTVISRPMTDANDWYLINLDDAIFRPFLYQIEKPPVLDTPTDQDESARERKLYTWGAYGRYNVAYGAWWKAVTVTN